jgi:hypothetical protein
MDIEYRVRNGEIISSFWFFKEKAVPKLQFLGRYALLVRLFWIIFWINGKAGPDFSPI